MDDTTIKTKQKTLEEIFKKLAEAPIEKTDVNMYIENFQEIFVDDFRPLYSKLFLITKNKGSISVLDTNLRLLYDEVCVSDNQNEAYVKAIIRIYDHLTIDTFRMSVFYDTQKISQKINKTEKEIISANTNLNEVKDKVNSMQKEYIAILGIFSAIVITFVAGLTFTSSVLQNIEKASIYRLILVIWLLGFILLTALHSLFSFIENITHKKKSDIKGSSSIIDGFINTFNQTKLKVEEKKLLIKFFLIGLSIIFLLWFFDIVNLRQKIIQHLYNTKIEQQLDNLIEENQEKQSNNLDQFTL